MMTLKSFNLPVALQAPDIKERMGGIGGVGVMALLGMFIRATPICVVWKAKFQFSSWNRQPVPLANIS